MAELVYERSAYGYYPTLFVVRVINTVVGVIEAMLALRLALELLGASTASAFVLWVFTVTERLVAPFFGAFPSLSLGSAVLDLSTIFAMAGYAVIGWLAIRVLSFFLHSLDA